jgi:hypothetical protein
MELHVSLVGRKNLSGEIEEGLSRLRYCFDR